MNWYPKELKGMDDLERERRRLTAARKKTAGADFLFSGIPLSNNNQDRNNNEQGGETAVPPGLSGLLTGLLTSRTVLGGVLAAGAPLLRFLPAKLQRKILSAFVREFFGGYIRWKGLSLGFRYLRHLLRKRHHD